MPDHAERKPEETEDVNEETPDNKPRGLIQYPAEPGKTQYGTYQNPHK